MGKKNTHIVNSVNEEPEKPKKKESLIQRLKKHKEITDTAVKSLNKRRPERSSSPTCTINLIYQ